MTYSTSSQQSNRAERRHRAVDLPPRLAYPVDEAAQLCGVGKTKLRELIASGSLGHIRVDRRVLVPLSSIEDYISRQLDRHPS